MCGTGFHGSGVRWRRRRCLQAWARAGTGGARGRLRALQPRQRRGLGLGAAAGETDGTARSALWRCDRRRCVCAARARSRQPGPVPNSAALCRRGLPGVSYGLINIELSRSRLHVAGAGAGGRAPQGARPRQARLKSRSSGVMAAPHGPGGTRRRKRLTCPVPRAMSQGGCARRRAAGPSRQMPQGPRWPRGCRQSRHGRRCHTHTHTHTHTQRALPPAPLKSH